MAAKKKVKKKKKSLKVAKKRPPTRKKVAKKARRAPTPKRKTAKKKPARSAVGSKAKVAAKTKPGLRLIKPAVPAAAMVPANEERIGVVTHYFTHLGVAIVQLETGVLHEGDTVHVKGHTSDFTQRAGSMEVDHVHVAETRAGQSFGLKVKEHAREHDVVYRVKGM